ncbi:hypothetical protein OROHE_016335 [Orobanche hederae]
MAAVTSALLTLTHTHKCYRTWLEEFSYRHQFHGSNLPPAPPEGVAMANLVGVLRQLGDLASILRERKKKLRNHAGFTVGIATAKRAFKQMCFYRAAKKKRMKIYDSKDL